MKTDRELLEAAAKAAGKVPADEIDAHIPSGGMWVVGRGGRDEIFDPLRDDGDAFRLAVKLSLDLCVSPNYRLCAWSAVTSDWVEESPGSDPCAAMRRVIVRAAAMAG